MTLPPGFLWGTATSSHQVEGHTDNDWTDWESQPGRIHDGTRSGGAAGWWAGQAEEDLARAAALGHNAHRMSLEWSRLEPEPGRYDDAAFARYAAILKAARRLGLRVMVTLNHFTLPRWASRGGAWLDPQLPERFAALAARAGEALAGQVALWATLNEPAVLATMGYMRSTWPPGLGDPLAGFRALAALLEAHALAYAQLKRVQGAPVGLVLNLPLFEHARRDSGDLAAARAQDWAFNGAKLRALSTGWLLPPLGVPRRLPGLRRAYDFLGLNYYGRFAVRFDGAAPEQLFGRHVQRPTVATEHNDWGQVCPRGLTEQLLRLARLAAPVYVTENGLYDPTDAARPDFLVRHVAAIEDAARKGADVRGYFVWSLVDNFEWAEGWSAPFGLLALNRATGERSARASAEAYAAIIRAGGVEPLPQAPTPN
ncbi:MAG: family 1 glycosylhydrolase [Myxococcota bacterium]